MKRHCFVSFKYLITLFFQRDYIRYVTYFTEKSVKLMNQSNKITGKPVSYQTLIIDLEHFSVNQISHKPCMHLLRLIYQFKKKALFFSVMDVGMETIRMSEANYPEGVRRVFLINGNFFLGDGTRQPSMIYDSDTI